MDINEYQSSIRNFVTYPKEIGVFYNLFEISAAFGDLSKKVNETLISNKEFDRNQSLRLAISLGDILNAISNFALDIGVSMDEVIALNLKKIAVLKELIQDENIEKEKIRQTMKKIVPTYHEPEEVNEIVKNSRKELEEKSKQSKTKDFIEKLAKTNESKQLKTTV